MDSGKGDFKVPKQIVDNLKIPLVESDKNLKMKASNFLLDSSKFNNAFNS